MSYVHFNHPNVADLYCLHSTIGKKKHDIQRFPIDSNGAHPNSIFFASLDVMNTCISDDFAIRFSPSIW